MGSQCCHENRPHSQEIIYSHIIKKHTIKEPNKQNLLTPPLNELGEKDDDYPFFEKELVVSFHKTATFNSNIKNSLKNTDLVMSADNQNHIIEKQQPIKQTLKDQQFTQIKVPVVLQQPVRNQQAVKKKSLIRSSSINHLPEKKKGSDNLEKQDSESNTKKSILKNKGYVLPKSHLSRGVSLKQNQKATNDDSMSVKTVKSQNKRVQFDPKIFRPKNKDFQI